MSGYTADIADIYACVGPRVPSNTKALTAGEYYPVRVMNGNSGGINYVELL